MIEKIIVENFGPIYEKTEIVFTIGNNVEEYNSDDPNVIPGTEILKTIFFYGGNNSGKSQTLKLFKFLKDIHELGRKMFEKANYLPNVYVEKSLPKSLDKLTKIEYFFYINNNRYSYKIELCFAKKFIYKEVLMKFDKIIFKRSHRQVDSSTPELEQDIFYLTHQVSKEGGNEDTKEVYEFMKNLIFINPEVNCGALKSFNSSQIVKLETNLKKINETLENFGFDFNIYIRKNKELDSENKEVFVKKGDLRSKFGILESFGTECFLKLLLEIINVESNTIVIDEVERGLNFELLSEFLKFLNKAFPQKQFILATHMTDFLEESYRKDQFYTTDIVEYRLVLNRTFDKKKFRNSHNFRKFYVSGSVGGISKVKKEKIFKCFNKEVDKND